MLSPARKTETGSGASAAKKAAAKRQSFHSKETKAVSASSALPDFVRQLIPLVRPYWLRQLEVLAYMLIGAAYTLVLPLSGKYLVDHIIPEHDTGMLGLFILGLVAVYLINTLVQLRRAYINNWVNQRILLDLQQTMFNHLQKLSHNFYAKAKTGDIMTRMAGDLQSVQQAMTMVLGVGVFQSLNMVVVIVAVIILNPVLGGLVLIIIPLFITCYLLLRSRLEEASRERAGLNGEVAAALQENLLAHGVIKAFGLEEQAVASYHTRLTALFKAMLRLVIFGSLFETSIGLDVTFGQLIVLGAGGYLAIHAQLSTGTLLAFIGLVPGFFSPVAQLSSVGQTVEMAAGSLERINELLHEPVEVTEQPGAPSLAALTREIRLENVTFGYDSQAPVLRNLNLTIPAGSHLAVVGPSGSGKTSLLNLLLRFWDPLEGRILFDGQALPEVRLASLRRQIGIVFQDAFIFDTTLRENIALSRTGASEAEIRAAVKAACLEEFVESLPQGLDTRLGERGVKMSGGQRQRLAIARALLGVPPILILDEATSALDAKTESEILETLKKLRRGRTTISVTHRLSLAATADYIVVLDQGEIVEQGTHTELVQASGLYRRLYEEQTHHVTRNADETIQSNRSYREVFNYGEVE
ncbi:MAG TPA: ABC transporter ATP-binding protein [Chloroflexia bacterium]|nr:ABC transporter ATP-binding protein [Chloroflexia bacterium]